MLRSDRARSGLPRPLALIIVLAFTAAWTVPSHAGRSGSGMVDGAAAAPRVAAATWVDATARDDAFDGWSQARDQRYSTPKDTSATWAPSKAPTRPAAETTSKPEKKARGSQAQTQTAKTSTPTYRGTNHFWIPSLGMSYGVHPYSCGSTYYPANRIYRWGCAGRNNVYLFGHAHSVMKPLHDLYVRGGLRKGMVAVYANANGKITKYRVTEWRVVRPTEIAWQIASQPVPSMTLQTCIGKDSQYRLNVRLVAFD